MNAMSNILPPTPAIAWPAPVINSISDAAEDASMMAERLRRLVADNNGDILEDIALSRGSAECLRQRAHEIAMIGAIVEEKVEELQRILAAIAAAAAETRTNGRASVGRHVDIRRSANFREAVNVLAALNSRDDLDACAVEAAVAFQTLLRCRVTSPTQFREKMDIIAREEGFTTHEVIPELFRDLDAIGWTSAITAEA